ncbi:MAG: hypothetical protein EZS28_026095 [Streblomastix strix]|uniref:Uncharacterized protein n=1 Tax=Streblomastix strix TaxID=222440 RepID=A0A5J4V6I8_9EUKA|nr:MAG: hypothetical protein EZS28_026095 [Streblomastix strix]
MKSALKRTVPQENEEGLMNWYIKRKIMEREERLKDLVKHGNRQIRYLAARIGRLNFLQTLDRRNVSVSSKSGQGENICIKDKVIGLVYDGEYKNDQKDGVVDKENIGQLSRIIDSQNCKCILTTNASRYGQGATLIYENQVELILHVLEKNQDKAILIRSDNITAVYDIGKSKMNESLIQRIKQEFQLVRSLQFQITTIHIPGKLNSSANSLSRLCISRDYTLRYAIIQMNCKTLNQMPQIEIFASQYNKPINNQVTSSTEDEKNNAQGRTIAPIWSKQSCKQDPRDLTENERQGSKTSTRQCWRLPSGPVAEVGRDLLMRCMKMREFSEEGVNILFKSQRFNTVKWEFYS